MGMQIVCSSVLRALCSQSPGYICWSQKPRLTVVACSCTPGSAVGYRVSPDPGSSPVRATAINAGPAPGMLQHPAGMSCRLQALKVTNGTNLPKAPTTHFRPQPLLRSGMVSDPSPTSAWAQPVSDYTSQSSHKWNWVCEQAEETAMVGSCPSLHKHRLTARLFMVDLGSSAHILFQPYHSLAPSGCLCAANLSPLPGFILWSLSFSSQPWRVPAGLRIRLGTSWIFCAGFSLFCQLQSGCYTLLQASEVSLLSLISELVKGLPRVRELFLFHCSIPWARILSQFFLFLFFFVLPSYMEIFLVVLLAWDLPEFSRHSLRNVPQVHVFLMYL